MSSDNHYTAGQGIIPRLNLPPPLRLSSWQFHMKAIEMAGKSVAKDSMDKADDEVRKDGETISDVTVSCDGTWQRRGFASKNGIWTVLIVDGPAGSSKVIDTCTLSNYCDSCAKKASKMIEDDLLEWKKTHACSKNYDGSAGAMEPAGMVQIFKWSVSTRHLRYTGYLGDGDSKSYSAVTKNDPPLYRGKNVLKYECCHHVQKCMGKTLADKVNEYKSHQLTENGKKYKGIGGVNRLTQKAIKNIQGHYGAAI